MQLTVHVHRVQQRSSVDLMGKSFRAVSLVIKPRYRDNVLAESLKRRQGLEALNGRQVANSSVEQLASTVENPPESDDFAEW